MSTSAADARPLTSDPSPVRRVVSVPANHRYVTHAIACHDGIEVAEDPVVPGAAPGQWWPHGALETTWIWRHAARLDVVHVHFGFETRSPAQLEVWCDEVRRAGLRLVVTVHDLTLPHSRDHAAHRARLGVLVRSADDVLTLTKGAALAVQKLWGTTPLVIPHPHMVPLDRMAAVTPRAPGPWRVGLHLKSSRANSGAADLVEPLARVTRRLGATLLVHAHDDVLDPGFARYDEGVAEALRHVGRHPHVEVVTGPRMTDMELWDYLEHLDVSVLPHRWGTHSGWGEECRDLGTVPLVPDVGHLVEQLASPSYRWAGHRVDEASLERGLGEAISRARDLRGPATTAERVRRRAEQAARIGEAHRSIYARSGATAARAAEVNQRG